MVRRVAKAKVAAAIGAAAMALSAAMPAMAAGKYTPVVGGEMYFGKYLIMDGEANVPPVKFDYTIAAGTAKSYSVDGRKFEVLAGPMPTPNAVTISNKPDFKVGDPTYTTPQTATNIKDNANPQQAVTDQVTLENGEKYARAEVKIDFSGVTFDEPGVYRYVLTETASPASYAGIINDSAANRVVDVYVTDNNGALAVSGYVLHSAEDDITMSANNGTNGTNPTGKSQGYTNRYVTHDLTLSKNVSGNQASKDKYFKFTVVINGAVPGTKYDVAGLTGSNPTADQTVDSNSATIDSYEGKTNPTALTADANGSITQDFYLSHGQVITINGIPDSAKYTVTETQEDYKPSLTVTGDTTYVTKTDNSIADNAEGATGGIKADTTNAFVNTREGVVPTGVIMTVAPYATLVLLGGAGATIMMRKKEEE